MQILNFSLRCGACKQGDLVPDHDFCIVPFQPCAKMLVGNFPNPSQTASAGCRLRVLSERFHPHTNKKARQRPTQNRPLTCFVYRLCCRSSCGVSSAKNRSIFFCARKNCCILPRALQYFALYRDNQSLPPEERLCYPVPASPIKQKVYCQYT